MVITVPKPMSYECMRKFSLCAGIEGTVLSDSQKPGGALLWRRKTDRAIYD